MVEVRKMGGIFKLEKMGIHWGFSGVYLFDTYKFCQLQFFYSRVVGIKIYLDFRHMKKHVYNILNSHMLKKIE